MFYKTSRKFKFDALLVVFAFTILSYLSVRLTFLPLRQNSLQSGIKIWIQLCSLNTKRQNE